MGNGVNVLRRHTVLVPCELHIVVIEFLLSAAQFVEKDQETVETVEAGLAIGYISLHIDAQYEGQQVERNQRVSKWQSFAATYSRCFVRYVGDEVGHPFEICCAANFGQYVATDCDVV